MRNEEIIHFPISEPPRPGMVKQLFDGVYWARMPLPMLIDHVNVYILEGAYDLTIIDTGLNVAECKSAWLKIIKNFFPKKPIKRVVLTHHHPDHVGLLGWFCKHFEIEVFASRKWIFFVEIFKILPTEYFRVFYNSRVCFYLVFSI